MGLEGCLLIELLLQKEKVPMPFAWLGTFFIQFFSLPLTLLLISGRIHGMQSSKPEPRQHCQYDQINL